MSQELRISHDNHVTRITLNRPDKANALGAQMVEDMIAVLEEVRQDGTRLLVLEGVGKHFCAGFDLSDLEEVSEGDLVQRMIRTETLIQKLYHLPLPTLALTHGRVFGAGADLVCACSQRISESSSSFRMPGLAFGIVLGTRRLAHCIGMDAAREIQNGGREFDAQEALRLGFIRRIAERETWPDIVAAAAKASTTLPHTSTEALFRVTAPDTRDADMAELARSASHPGLKARITAYREAAKQAAGKTAGKK